MSKKRRIYNHKEYYDIVKNGSNNQPYFLLINKVSNNEVVMFLENTEKYNTFIKQFKTQSGEFTFQNKKNVSFRIGLDEKIFLFYLNNPYITIELLFYIYCENYYVQ